MRSNDARTPITKFPVAGDRVWRACYAAAVRRVRGVLRLCPCGSGALLPACCGRYLAGESAPTAALLMRSRYTAFTCLDEAYLLATWHPVTRPQHLHLAQDTPRPQWLGLKIVNYQLQDATHATVAFVARQKIAGRASRLAEVSRFVLETGRWFYVDGDVE